MRVRIVVALAASFVFSMSAALGGNIVLNGNFGTGDLTSWTVNTSSSDPWEVLSDSDTYPGDTYYVSTGCVGAPCITGTTSEQGSLSQVLTTVNGSTYTLSFEFDTQGDTDTEPNGTPNELDVLWDGVSVLDLGPGGTLGPVYPYTLYTVTGLVGTGSDTVTFLGRQDPGFDALDNVCVSTDSTCGSASSVPEPATAALLGVSLIALLAGLRVRRQV